MPLSTAPIARKHVHTRKISCLGFEREDGLFDIEGRMTDTKTNDIDNRDRGGQIKAGEAIHDMSIRLTIDLGFNIHAVEAVIDHSPFGICPQIAGRLKQLEGEQIAAGWNQKVKTLFAGNQGCTHLTELLAPIATTAFQATTGARLRQGALTQSTSMNPLVNSCHALAEDGDVIKVMWPDQYRPKAETA